MQRQNNWRIRTIAVIVLCLSMVLIFSAYRLQIQYNHKYVLISDKNRIRITPIFPKRGRIITSDGVVIAKSVNRYKLLLSYCSEKDFAKVMEFIKNNISLNEQEANRIAESRKNRNAFTVIRDDLQWDEYAKIAVNAFKLSHLSIERSYIREYIDAEIFSHITGYATRNRDMVQSIVGQTGLEANFNELLSGCLGSKQTEVNATGKVMRTLDSIPPQNGKDLRITINSNLQKFVYGVMMEQKAGGCVVLDMQGNILALVSVPGFDTNLLSKGMSVQKWKELRDDGLFPMLNRVTCCTYPPGSIFKIIVALAALSEGIVSPKDKIFCSGGVKQDNHVFHCWNRGGHGYLNLSEALQYSCDCYFFEISKRLGIDKIVQYAEKFGYGTKVGVELTESKGLLPTKEWKFLKYKTTWRPYETMIAGIGQGSVLSTVIQTATMFGRLYTNNYAYTPTLIGRSDQKYIPMDIKDLDVVKNALKLVCTSGTAAGSCNVSYGIAGKTGSSQVRKLKSNEVGMHQSNFAWKYRDHAFFAGVAPIQNPQYIVVVFAEHGGGGASVAAPIARKIFDKLLVKR